MKWYKILLHDLRCGLLRARYLLIPILFLIPCLSCFFSMQNMNVTCSWAGYLMYCFRGIPRIHLKTASATFILPINWLLLMAGPLLLNFDYFLNDITNAGQQVIIRSTSRTGWYISKCVWNCCSTLLFFFIGWGSVAIFTVLTNGHFTMEVSAEVCQLLFADIVNEGNAPITSVSMTQYIISVLSLPMLSIASLNLLQMTLALYVKPILSFIGVMCILIISLFWYSPFALANGAMLLRSGQFVVDGINAKDAAMIGDCVLLICTALGSIKFKKLDILGLEE